GILSGTMGRSVEIKQIEEQVKEVRRHNFQGISFFYWETLWTYFTPNSPRERRKVFDTLFAPPSS
ncbi:MAG: glycoside hydrolase family 10 protein, partial [Cyanobacteriota bacterium]|nr:glycoside hydrolase family 10 protein [Cyanobacteriota bacterium]